MLNKIKELIGLPVHSDEIFDSSTAINAKSAYMNTKYGRDRSREQLLRDFFKDTNGRIKTKTIQNEYCCMAEIDEDILCYLPVIMERYRDQLGYNVALITNGTKIQQPGEEPVEIKPASTFIIIMWNNANISEPEPIIIADADTDDDEEPVV